MNNFVPALFILMFTTVSITVEIYFHTFQQLDLDIWNESIKPVLHLGLQISKRIIIEALSVGLSTVFSLSELSKYLHTPVINMVFIMTPICLSATIWDEDNV